MSIQGPEPIEDRFARRAEFVGSGPIQRGVDRRDQEGRRDERHQREQNPSRHVAARVDGFFGRQRQFLDRQIKPHRATATRQGHPSSRTEIVGPEPPASSMPSAPMFNAQRAMSTWATARPQNSSKIASDIRVITRVTRNERAMPADVQREKQAVGRDPPAPIGQAGIETCCRDRNR